MGSGLRDNEERAAASVPAICIGIIVACAGFAILAGLIIESFALTSVSGSFSQVKANSSLLLLLSGVSLALLGARRAVRVAMGLGALVSLGGLATLLEYTTERSFEIDDVLVHGAGRMGPNTALCFLLVGAALVMLGGGRRYVIAAQCCALVSGTIALASVVGYWFGVPVAEKLLITANLAPMAQQTAVLLLFMTAGAVVARTDTGMVARIRSRTPGGILLRQLLVPALLAPLIAGFLIKWGEEAGWYTSREGMTLLATVLAATLVVSVWLTAAIINRVEEARRQSQARSRSILETAVDGVVTIDMRGTILEVNSAVEQMFGHSREDLVGSELASCMLPERLRQAHRAGLVKVAAYPDSFEERRFESVGLRANGEEFPIEISIGRPSGVEPPVYVGNLRDISEKTRLETDLRQAQKMEALGQLAGGLAHDFNNLLTVITGYGDVMRDEIGSGPGREELEQITGSADRATELVRQLLAFSRQQVLALEVLDLKEIVQSIVPMLRPLLGEDIEISCNFQDDDATVEADRGQLEQVLMNLSVNARDAMPTGGSLVIEVENRRFEDPYIEEHLNIEPGEYVVLCVTDTGTGIRRDMTEHLFEPFFTTKEVGKGTGLGLATVHGIVMQLGGDIHVYSELELGTTFKVYLPKAAAVEAVEVETADEPELDPSGSETVLVCEDDPAVRGLIRRILTGAGYEVLLADTPSVALLLMEQHGDKVDALISDVIMPEMAGPQLAEKAQAMRPDRDLPVLLVSGYTPETVRERASLPPGMAYLEKPFDRKVLLHRLNGVLTAPSSSQTGDFGLN